MSLGPRLVIPGAIFGSFFLAILLYLITSGLSYPAAAMAEEMGSSAAVITQDSLAGAEADIIRVEQDADGPLDVELDGEIPQGDCEVSDQFPEGILQWCGLITHFANKRSLSPDLVAALILQESGGDPVAFSHSGAVGLMQVMPNDGPSASFMCINGPCFANRPSTGELEDPQFNVSYGTKMLSGLVQKYGDMREALRAYGPMDAGYSYADKVLGIYQRFGK